jgi:hypothetical protein
MKQTASRYITSSDMEPQPHRGARRVAYGISETILTEIRMPGTGLAIWQRQPAATHPKHLAALPRTSFRLIAEGPPANAALQLRRELPIATPRLAADIRALGRRFADIAGVTRIRLRLDGVADDACRRFHVDAVRLRLLCTYIGSGTEWIDGYGRVQHIGLSHVAIFKGDGYPDATPRILHRSPPLSALPVDRRFRLLLCIDEAGFPDQD